MNVDELTVMNIIDTHCHLYLNEFKDEEVSVIQRAIGAGVSHFFLPAIDSEYHHDMIRFEGMFPDKCFAMMGLHPCSVKENINQELGIVEQWLKERSFIAIGEIGIDLYWDKKFFNNQVIAFKQQIEWAHDLRLPIVIHSRNSTQECIEVLQSFPAGYVSGIFHCFSGNEQEARTIIELGFYLGIGGVVTFKNAGFDKTLKEISPNHLVLETDAPYLAPVPYRGKRNESSYLTYIVAKLSEVYNMDADEIKMVTTQNASKVFGVSF